MCYFLLAFLLLGVLLLWTKRQQGARKLTTLLSLLIIFIIIFPSAEYALTYLENRYPRLESVPPDAVGIILLGGSFNFKVTQARGITSYNEAAGRILAFVELARQNPDKQLVFSGRGRYEDPELSESYLAKTLFPNLGLDMTAITFEERSRNTLENAVFSAQLLKPQPQEKWVLVTSAFHMPRAMGLFRHAGFNVIAYPVDYHTTGHYDFRLSLGLTRCLLAWRIVGHELFSLTRNYFYGHSDVWLPAPYHGA